MTQLILKTRGLALRDERMGERREGPTEPDSSDRRATRRFCFHVKGEAVWGRFSKPSPAPEPNLDWRPRS
jgi:hypothetical protein